MNTLLFDFANFAIGAAAAGMIAATPAIVNKLRYGGKGKPVESLRLVAIQDLNTQKERAIEIFSKREEKLAEIADALKKHFPNSNHVFTLSDIGFSDSNLKSAIDCFNLEIEKCTQAKREGELEKIYKKAQSTWYYRETSEGMLERNVARKIEKIKEVKDFWSRTSSSLKRFTVRIERAKVQADDIYERYDHLYFETLPPLMNNLSLAAEDISSISINSPSEPKYIENLSQIEKVWNRLFDNIDKHLSKAESEIENLNSYENNIFPHTKKLRNAIRTANGRAQYTAEAKEKFKEKALESIVRAEMNTYTSGNPRKQYENSIKPAIEFIDLFNLNVSAFPKIP